MFSVWEMGSIAIEAVLYMFHVSVLIVILVKFKKRLNEAFFQLLVIVFIEDFIYYIFVTCIGNRMLFHIRHFSFLESNQWLIKFMFILASILSSSQFLGHTLIAFTRLTSIWDNIYHQKIWSKNWYLPILFIFPLLPCLLIFNSKFYISLTTTDFLDVGIVNKSQAHICILLSFLVMLFCTILSAIFNGLSLWIWNKRKNSLNFQQNKQNEAGLLGIAITLFVVQIIRCGHTFALHYSVNNLETKKLLFSIIPLTVDLYAWVGSASIVILKKNTPDGPVLERLTFASEGEAKAYVSKKAALYKIGHFEDKECSYYRVVKCDNECLKNPDQHILPGDYILRDLAGFGRASHAGVYVGRGKVIHYDDPDVTASVVHCVTGKGGHVVHVAPIEKFVTHSDQEIRILVHCFQQRTPDEKIAAAEELAKVQYGQYEYGIFSNNCQHLASLVSCGRLEMVDQEIVDSIQHIALIALGMVLAGVAKTMYDYFFSKSDDRKQEENA